MKLLKSNVNWFTLEVSGVFCLITRGGRQFTAKWGADGITDIQTYDYPTAKSFLIDVAKGKHLDHVECHLQYDPAGVMGLDREDFTRELKALLLS